MSDRIYLSSPDVGELEEQYVVAAMRSGWIAPLGPDVDAFESEMTERLGVGHAVALSCGIAALHLGLLGMDTKDVVLADIRDGATLNESFAERQPEVVVHAAALKHLPMLELYPDEAWKTAIIEPLHLNRQQPS